MATDPSQPARDLPPVQPPSGRFIVQLFLVPGMIVLFVVLLVLGINYLFVGGNTPEQFLLRLDSDNPDIRWRGANDLAQVLKRRESVNLKTDVTFALDLVQRLDAALVALLADEKAIGDQLDKNRNPEDATPFRRLEPQRNLVNFLAASLGDFHFPAGVPTLCDIIGKDASPDVLHHAYRRRQAVWSLCNLGENIKAFANLKAEQKHLVISSLRAECESAVEARRRAAKNALKYLHELPNAADPELVRVDAVLSQASRAEDRFLREQVAFAFNFWDGPEAEATLLRLARDDGFGTLLRTPDEP